MLSRHALIVTASLAASISLAAFAGGGRKPDAPQGGVAGNTCSCTGDFDHNGSIDAADLAVMLGAWGAAGADLNGSGSTDAADLAILLGLWGPCSTPSNDECGGAIEIVAGDEIAFCNTMATNSGQTFPLGSCGPTATTVGHDLWYVYSPEGDGELTLATCGSDFDTVLAVYTSVLPGASTCPPVSGLSTSVLVGCDDDGGTCGFGSNTSKLTIDVLAGQIYKIRVGGYTTASGSGVLTATFKSVGSQCFDGILVNSATVAPKVVTGTTIDNGLTYPPCANTPSKGEWITYIPSCQEEHVFLSTCNDGTDFDTVLAVWKETAAAGCDGELKACVDDTQSASCSLNGFFRKSKADFYANAGHIYHILVAGYNAGAAGSYKLTIDADCVTP